MKKFLQSNKKMLLGLLLFIVIFPTLILCPSPIGLIPRDIGLAIVGYGGSILGGFLTLYGVWWTIDDNNKNRREELELQYCPILTAKVVDKSSIPIHQSDTLSIRSGDLYFCDSPVPNSDSDKIIRICNVGRGEIENIFFEVKSCDLFFSYPYKKVNCFSAAVVSNDISRTFIPIGECLYLDVAFPKISDDNISGLFPGLPISVNHLREVDTCIDFEAVVRISIRGAFSSRKRNYTLHLKAQKYEPHSLGNFPNPNKKFELEISDFTYDPLS